MHTFTLLGKLLGVENFAATDGVITLSVEQMQSIENAMSAHETRQGELETEITALKKSPAADTTNVVDTGKHDGKQAEKSDVENFVDTVNSARALYNMLPKV